MRIQHHLHEIVRRLVRFSQLGGDDVLSGGFLVDREEGGFKGCPDEERRVEERRVSFGRGKSGL